MAGHGEKLGRKQEEAIAALLSQRNIEDAARMAGVGARTLIRWLKLPEFGKEYRKARREAVHQSVARLQQATGAAASVVLKLMTDPNIPAAVRLRAAECVFDRAIKGVELEDIEARVAELEESKAMITRNLARRLERLESELTPSSDERGVTIVLTSPACPTRSCSYATSHLTADGACDIGTVDSVIRSNENDHKATVQA